MKASNLREGTPPVAPPRPAAGAAVITDADGRRLQLRGPLGLLEEQRLLVAMGAHSDNARALQRTLLAARVAAVDDVPIPVPTTYRAYEAMLAMVGTAGLIAVVEHLAPPPTGEPVAVFEGDVGDYRLLPHEGGVALYRDDGPAPGEDAEIAAAKKLPGTPGRAP